MTKRLTTPGSDEPEQTSFFAPDEMASLVHVSAIGKPAQPEKDKARRGNTSGGVLRNQGEVLNGSLRSPRRKSKQLEGGDNASLIEANKLMQLRVASIAEWGRKKKLGVPRWTPLNIARIGLPLTELMEGLEGIWRRESGRVKSLAYFYVALQELEAHGFNPKVIQLDAHRSGQKSMRELLDEADADAMRAMLAAEKGS